MRKIITKDQTIELNKHTLYPKDISANDIRIESDKDVDLHSLNLNIVKYELDNKMPIHIENCNINKLILNKGNGRFYMINSTINDIYIQSEMEQLAFRNTNIPNLHGRIDLINKIEIEQ